MKSEFDWRDTAEVNRMQQSINSWRSFNSQGFTNVGPGETLCGEVILVTLRSVQSERNAPHQSVLRGLAEYG